MKCKDCKFKRNISNTDTLGIAICSYPSSYFIVNIEDNCHFIPDKEELKCGDCYWLKNDWGCVGCEETESAYRDGKLCSSYLDRQEIVFSDILLFWKYKGIYDRNHIIELIDEFEAAYKELTEQGKVSDGCDDNE